MSIYQRLYSARIAPASADWREAIRNGVEVIDGGRCWRESFAHNAFIASDKPTPVVLSHFDDKVVGYVAVRIAHGGWHIADFTLDHSRVLSSIALDRLRVGAPVSIGFRSLHHDELLAEDGIKRHTAARLDELSILGPNEIPAFRGAKIMRIHELKPKRASRARAPEPEAEVIHVPADAILRRPSGRVLGVR